MRTKLWARIKRTGATSCACLIPHTTLCVVHNNMTHLAGNTKNFKQDHLFLLNEGI